RNHIWPQRLWLSHSPRSRTERPNPTLAIDRAETKAGSHQFFGRGSQGESHCVLTTKDPACRVLTTNKQEPRRLVRTRSPIAPPIAPTKDSVPWQKLRVSVSIAARGRAIPPSWRRPTSSAG